MESIWNRKTLIEAREALGFNKTEMATALGIGRTYLYMLEKGSKRPSQDVIRKYSELSGREVSFFLNSDSSTVSRG